MSAVEQAGAEEDFLSVSQNLLEALLAKAQEMGQKREAEDRGVSVRVHTAHQSVVTGVSHAPISYSYGGQK